MDDIHSDLPSDFSSDLKLLRPDLRRAHFICVKCRKEPRGWMSTATHTGGQGGEILSGDGTIYGALLCHGDEQSIMISFAQAARYIESGEKIPVFDSVNPFEPSLILGPDGNRLEN